MLLGFVVKPAPAKHADAPASSSAKTEVPVVTNAASPERTIKLLIVDGKNIRFHRISTADGLSQTRVANIVQDDEGFVWFGTQYGLNRFDGYKFKIFAHDSKRPDSLGGVYITEVFKDRWGALWVGCDQFLDKFNPQNETFTHYRLDAGDRDGSTINIHNINQDTSGMLWVSTGKGLYRLNPTTGSITRFTHNPHDPTTIGNNDIKNTGQDRSGTFWVAHSDGLDRFDTHTGKVNLHIALGESGVGIIFHQDRFGLFWIVYGNDGNLGVFNPNTKTITKYSRIEDSNSGNRWNPITAMIEDRDGTMWFGTGADGLLKFDRGNMRFIRYTNQPADSETLADNRVTTLFQDREGTIWIGLHQAGPNFFSKQVPLFGSPAQQAGQPIESGLVSVIYKDPRGIVWLGAGGGVLRRIDRKNGTAAIFDYTAGTDVLSIIEHARDVLSLGTSGSGLIRYDERTGQRKIYKNDPSKRKSLSSDMVEKVFIGHDGALWAATWDGLDRFDPLTGQFDIFKPEADYRGLNFHAIAEDANGILWLGSNLGLYRFDPKTATFTNYKNDLRNIQSLSDNRVNSIYFDRSGAMWVGTQNGLDRFDRASGRFATYSKEDGLAGNVVSCILEDNRGALWISTNNGVSSLDSRRKHFKNYGVNDGLPGLDLTGWGACSASSTGEMFFGGFSGATAFYPERLSDNSYVPPVTLTDFRIFGAEVGSGKDSPLKKSITSSSSITLSHWQNFFSLEFAALSFTDALTNRYRYMLDGLDRGWIESGSDARVANYTAVPPGTYVFRVQGATSRSRWSEPGVALQLIVLPPWWSTWWFRLICLVAFALTIFYFYRLRLHQATERLSVRFDERLAERTRIARELHDTLLQSFHGLMLRFQAAQNLLPERPAEARQSLETAIDRASDAITEGRDAIHELRSRGMEASHLVETLTSLGQDLAAHHSTLQKVVTFRVLVEGSPRQLAPIQEDVCRIMREAIANAFRHAHARQIEFDVRYGKRMLRLRVRDDGIGIERNLLGREGRERHWGLPGMRERAQAIGARFEVWSELGKGTEIELAIPAAVAYADLGYTKLGALIWKKRETQ